MSVTRDTKIRLNVPFVPEIALEALGMGRLRDQVMPRGSRDIPPTELADHGITSKVIFTAGLPFFDAFVQKEVVVFMIL